ncbi:MAG: 4Fe-4S binding protein [Ruthenibacterium sp.]
MLRKIIHIDEEKCNGCGACAAAHEGALAWWAARQNCCAMTIATAWAIACPRAPPAPSVCAARSRSL